MAIELKKSPSDLTNEKTLDKDGLLYFILVDKQQFIFLVSAQTGFSSWTGNSTFITGSYPVWVNSFPQPRSGLCLTGHILCKILEGAIRGFIRTRKSSHNDGRRKRNKKRSGPKPKIHFSLSGSYHIIPKSNRTAVKMPPINQQKTSPSSPLSLQMLQ